MTRRTSGDEGASLVLVLAFVLAFGLLAPTLVSLASTNVTSVAATRDQASTSYDADAAAQTAVNAVRQTGYDNAPGQGCFADAATPGLETASLVLDASNTPSGTTLVTCQPGAGTGFPSTVQVPINDANRPGTALLTLSRSASEPGIYQGSNNVFRIHGRVFSNSTIDVHVSSAKLIDDREVYARGSCAGNGQVLGVPTSCDDTAHDGLGVDPGYPQPTAVPPYQPVPGCAGNRKTYTFLPGYYDDASALSALSRSSCKDSLLLFRPGTYYFDFHDTGSHEWSISDGFLVAGTPRTSGTGAWDPTGYPGSTPPVPGSCIAPLESQTNGGVQFVFGNDSRMSVTGGAQVEVCGQYALTSPPIGIFGATSGTETTTTETGRPATSATSTATSPGSPAFAAPARATATDGLTTDAAFVGSGSSSAQVSATLVARGLAPTAAVPRGSVLVSAKVRVRHRDVATAAPAPGAGGIDALGLTLTPDRPGAATLSPSGTVAPAADTATGPLRDDTWDLTAALRQEVHDRGLTGAVVALTATTRKSVTATEQVDAVVLDLAWRAPAFRAQDLAGSCVGQVPYTTGGSGGCAVISTSGPSTAFYSQGTTYAPKAAIDVTLNNVSQQVFKFGLIVRTLRFDITGSSAFDQAVIAVPDDNTGPHTVTPLAVYLQVYLCPAGGCPVPPATAFGWVPPPGSGWVRRLAAKAVYGDPGPARTVSVQDWSYQR